MLDLIQQGKIAELLITIALSIIITAVAYLLVPTILCIVGYNTHRSYSLKTIKKIMIINSACVWFIFQIIRYNAGETGTSVAVVLWSGVAYWMMKKFLLEKDIALENDEAESDEKIELEIVDKNKKERSFKIPLIVVSVLLVLSLGLNLYQLGAKSDMEESLTQNQELEQELEQEKEQNSELQQKLKQNRNKIDFFDEYIVCVEDDNTGWYHKYECFRFRGREFWVYNIDQAKSLGYKPCPDCCKS